MFDRDLPYGTYAIFKNADSGHSLGEIQATPDEARTLKQTAKVAYTLVPKAPFSSSREGYPSDATVSDPYEVTTTTHAVFADLQCALLTDAGGRVLLAAAVD